MRNVRRNFVIVVVVSMILLFVAGNVSASSPLDSTMKPAIEEYLKITTPLAADKTDGVQIAAKKLVGLGKKIDVSGYTGKHSDSIKKIPGQISSAASKVASAKDIKGMREALKELSKPFALYASLVKPEGLHVAYCSCAPGVMVTGGGADQ